MNFVVEATAAMMYFAQRSDEWRIVDTRSSDEYIGWADDGQIGGHIPYAKLFSAEWLQHEWVNGSNDASYQSMIDLHLQSQGITSDKNIILYDDDAATSEIVFKFLGEKGFKHLFYFNIKNWAGDIYKYPNYKLVIPTWAVNRYLNGETVEGLPQGDVKIFEVSWMEPSEQYLSEHIPTAVHIDSNEVEKAPNWEMISDKELIEFAANNGVRPDSSVILYGDSRLNMGAACKFATIFRYMGVKSVQLLNGTIKNWVNRGYHTEAGNNCKTPCSVSDGFKFDYRHIMHLKEAQHLHNNPEEGVLVDTRNWQEYTGQDSGYPDLDRAGRIAGSVWCFFPAFYTTPIQQVGNLDIMFAAFENAGIDISKKTAFFCGQASWGASLPKLFTDIAGLESSSIYEGGWQEWSLYPENECETGVPEKYKDYDPWKFDASLLASSEKCHVL